MRKVMVFGTFDGLHKGHLWFLEHARQGGDYLIAVVARDSVVLRLKGRSSRKSESERVEALVETRVADEVVLGDEEEQTWSVVEKFRPDVIAVGYDQEELKMVLERDRERFDWNPKIEVVERYDNR